MVKNCPRCGNPNSPANRNCSTCGAQLSGGASKGEATPQDTQSAGGFAVQRWDQSDASDAPQQDVSTFTGSERYRSEGDVPTARSPLSGEVLPRIDPLSPPLRTDLPPNSGERQGQATFVPYTDDAVKKLEKQKSETAWLRPTIFAAGAILAILVVITILLLLTSGNAAPGSQIASGGLISTATPQATDPTAPTSPMRTVQPEATPLAFGALDPLPTPISVSLPCVLPVGATVNQTVTYTVCRSSEEQIKAWQTLDTAILKGSRTGFDLQDNIARVDKYKADKQYADPVLQSLSIVALRIDQTSAFVKTAESWSVTTYRSVDKSVVNRSGPTPYTEVYHLIKQSGKWFVDRVEFLPSSSP